MWFLCLVFAAWAGPDDSDIAEEDPTPEEASAEAPSDEADPEADPEAEADPDPDPDAEVVLPELVEGATPAYPDEAREQRIEGPVGLSIRVGDDGSVLDVEVTTPLHPLLDASAVEAARELVFTPATQAGEPVEVVIGYRFIFSLASAEDGASQGTAHLHGQVLDTDELPVPNATITLVRADGTGASVTRSSGSSGRFNAPMLPPGDWIATVEHPGFEPSTFELSLGPSETLNLDLVIVPTDSNEIVVLGVRQTWREIARGQLGPDEGTVTGVYELTRRDIESTPGSLEDVARAAQALPGVVGDSDLLAGFHVRGGEQDEVVFMLDRVPLQNPFHLGGFNSLFNPDMIHRVRFYTGAAPANVPAGSSAVMAVESWDGSPGEDGTGFDGAVDLSASSVRALLLGSLDKEDKWTIALAARRTYLEGYLQVMKWANVVDSAFAAPEFSELSARIAWRPNDRHRVIATVLQSGDSLALVDSEDESLVNFQGTFELRNRLTLTSLDHKYETDRFRWQTTAAWTRDAGLQRRDLAGTISQEQTLHRGYARTDLEQKIGDHVLQAGGDASVFQLRSNGTLQDNRAFPSWGTAGIADFGFGDMEYEASAPWFEASGYVNGEVRGPVRVRAGVRTTYAGNTGEVLVSPRAGLSVPLPTATIPKISAGIYHNIPRNPVELDDQLGNPDLGSERAMHAVVGVDQGFPLPGEEAGGLVRVEAYWIELDDLVVTPDDRERVEAGPAFENAGSGRNRGIDVMMAARTGPWNAHLTYGLLYAERTNPLNQTFAQQVAPPQDQRHTFSIAGDWKPFAHWRFTTRYLFHSGRPVSRVVKNDEETVKLDCLNCERLGPTHNIDVRAEWRRAYDRYRLTFYVEILNVGNIPSDFLPIHDIVDGELSTTMFRHLPMRPFLGLRADF